MRIPWTTESEWHALRAPRVGASDVASLFGCGYRSLFQLWHEKKGDLPPEDLSDVERVTIGRNLEDGIAGAAVDLYGYQLAKVRYYLIDEVTSGLGASLDYEWDDHGTSYPCEIKNASWGSWRDNWITNTDGTIEAPLRFQLQVQAQLACANAQRGLLIALIAGERLVRCRMDRHEAAIAEIRRRVDAFWQSIADNVEPEPQMPRDLAAANSVWPGGEGAADLSGDQRIEEHLRLIADLRIDAKRIDEEIDRSKAELLRFCSEHKLAAVKADHGRISRKWKEAVPEQVITRPAKHAHYELRITTA